MRMLIAVVFVSMGYMVCHAVKPDSSFYEALSNGARVRMVCHVVNEIGKPVANANVRVVLAKRDTECSLLGVTDEYGTYVIDGLTTGNYVQLSVDKQGYYSSWKKWSFIDMGSEHVVKDGKWQPYGGEVRITLRRILNCGTLVVHNKIIDVPATNVWFGFDMKAQSLVRPYGSGEISDIEIYVGWDGLPAWESKCCNAKMRFVSPTCGGYYVANILESKFPYPYHAEKTKAFQVKEVAIVERAGDPHQTNIPFCKGSSMVTRTRSILDAKGAVKVANYGCIRRFEVGPSRRGVALLRLSYVFNPTPNDTNLEPK